jgi:hypothetical protein
MRTRCVIPAAGQVLVAARNSQARLYCTTERSAGRSTCLPAAANRTQTTHHHLKAIEDRFLKNRSRKHSLLVL